MAKGKEDGVIDMHLKFYPEKFKSHRELIEKLRRYQNAMGLGKRDAFIMIMLHPEVHEQEEGTQRTVRISGKTLQRNQGKKARDKDVGDIVTEPENGIGDISVKPMIEIAKETDQQEKNMEANSDFAEDLFSSDDEESALSDLFHGRM